MDRLRPCTHRRFQRLTANMTKRLDAKIVAGRPDAAGAVRQTNMRKATGNSRAATLTLCDRWA